MVSEWRHIVHHSTCVLVLVYPKKAVCGAYLILGAPLQDSVFYQLFDQLGINSASGLKMIVARKDSLNPAPLYTGR